MKKQIQKKIRTNLMSNQVQQLTKFIHYNAFLEEYIIKYWEKDLLKPEEVRKIKTANTYFVNTIDTVLRRLDFESQKRVIYTYANTVIVLDAVKKYKDAVKALKEDTRLIDIALSFCDSCKVKNPKECDIRQVLADHKYPALWDNTVDEDLTPEEIKLKNHCIHCYSFAKE